MNIEIEAKFTIADEDVFERLLTLDHLSPYDLRMLPTAVVVDRYYDTEGYDLLRAGYACRVRQEDGSALASLKETMGVADGSIHRRQEIETPLPAPMEPDDWPEGPVRELMRTLSRGQPLRLLFELRQTRARRRVQKAEHIVAVLSLDRISLVAGSHHTGWLELEIELTKEGVEDDLRSLCASLLAHFPLQTQPQSKFERALRWRAAGAVVL